jgi:hypothetical protein
MAWSENRQKVEIPFTKEQLLEKIKNVNAVLHKLSKDDDFQDDLKSPEVKRALDHWTGRNRLPPEEAMKLQDNRRCIYVLQRLQMLQHVCHDAHIAVPFDLMMTGKDRLPESFVTATLGELLAKAPSANDNKNPTETAKTNDDKPANSNSTKSKASSPTATQAAPTPSTPTKPVNENTSEKKKTEDSKQKVEEKHSKATAAATTPPKPSNDSASTSTTTTTTEKKGPAPNSLLMLSASVAVIFVSIIIVFISSRTKA